MKKKTTKTNAVQKWLPTWPIDTLCKQNLYYITIIDARDRLKVASLVAYLRGAASDLYIGTSISVANMNSFHKKSTYNHRLTAVDHESIIDSLGIFDLIIVDQTEDMVFSQLYDTKADILKKLTDGVPTLMLTRSPISIRDIQMLISSEITLDMLLAEDE